MTDLTWKGGKGDFYDATQWTSGVAPVDGDTVGIFAGTADILGSEAEQSGVYDAQLVYLGSTSSSAPAQITATNATFGADFFLQQASAANPQNLNYSYMALLAIGTDVFAGTMDVQGATFGISTEASAGVPGGDLILATNGTIELTGATIALSGRFDDEGDFTLGAESALVNTGTINVESWTEPSFGTGEESSISGGGTVVIGLGGIASLMGTVTNQTFAFADPGVIALSNPSIFQGTIKNYATGDIISLIGIPATAATYNATTGILTALEGSTPVATLHVAGPTASGALTVTSDGDGGAIIEEPNSPALSTYTIAAADIAMGSNIVRATLTTAAGVPITGAGIKVGIISGSFNNEGGANADASAGYLPANANGTSAVTVLLDEADGQGDDEGRAMAELVHQVAPGAQLYFTTGATEAEMASGIGSMVADGVNIIVDDISSQSEPFFQVTGSVDTAIQAALSKGVSYFTSATNYANSYYQASFTKTATTDLTGGPSGTNYAQTFTNGTNYQNIILNGTSNIDLQWDAPFPTTSSGTSPLGMQMELLDAQTGELEYTSEQATSADNISDYTSEPEISMLGVAPGSYVIAIYQTAAEAAAVPVTTFKYIIFGNGGAPAAIGDPAASNGSGGEHGHDLVPGVNAVAATSFTNYPAFTGDDTVEPFSADGPGELLFDSNGNRLATPITNDAKPEFTAPDGIDVTSDLTGFQPFYGTSAAAPDAAAVAALVLQANPNLETNPTQVTSLLQSTALNDGLPANEEGAGLVQAVGAVKAAEAACFAAGTRLLTSDGEISIEALAVGDVVVCATGEHRRVQWIGRRRVHCRRHPDPAAVWPVRISAGAFAAGIPRRTLRLSPDHAVFLDGVLIPIKHLINGHSIAQHPVEAIEYWHVELASHDILLAEGLACESYLDTGNRAAFENAETVQLYADFAPLTWDDACAPLVQDGPRVVAAKQRLFARAASRVGQPALSLTVMHGRAAIDAHSVGGAWHYVIPPTTRSLHLVSPAWVPSFHHAASLDRRRLGVRLLAVSVDDQPVPLDAAVLAAGFHPIEMTAEGPSRWTDGRARLALPPGATSLSLRVGDNAAMSRGYARSA